MDLNTTPRSLPENAFRELKPGETYIPTVRDEEIIPEVTSRSILIGFLMTIIFSAAVGYITLKTGNGIEAAVPIAIIAVGISAALRRKSTVLENVNILAIGATSSGVIGGTVFVLPALWILGVDEGVGFFQIALVALLGAILGMLFLIPFRRYFVQEMHGKFPFPEGTAITEILMAGEKGGKQAKILTYSLGLGFLYDGVVLFFQAWREVVSTTVFKFMAPITDGGKLIFSFISSAAMAGLGFIIGIRFATIIMVGSFLSWWILVPLFGGVIPFISLHGIFDLPAPEKLAAMSADDLFFDYVRTIGIGGIFSAGLISIFKLRKVIWQAMTTGLEGLFGSLKKSGDVQQELRTDQDIPMPKVLMLLAVVSVSIFIFFRFSVLTAEPGATLKSLISTVIVLGISFLFTAVSAWAIAMISVTPVSGMTLTTLIITSLVMVKLGLGGTTGILATVLVGTVVCTALAMAGTLVTEFKIGYWVGATPRKIQVWNLLSALVAALVGALVIILLAKTYGFTPDSPRALPAPQANAMAAVIQSFFSHGQVPWELYLTGAAIALLVEFVGISSLAFALGMYLPIEINSPIFFGAIIAWMLQRSAKSEQEAQARTETGTVVASGLIAGGSLAGIATAFIILFNWDKFLPSFERLYDAGGSAGNWVGTLMFAGLLGFLYWYIGRRRT